MFDGVKLIARYLETRYLVEPGLISETTLTELLVLLLKTKNENLKVEELYDLVRKMYTEDNKILSKKLTTETEIFVI